MAAVVVLPSSAAAVDSLHEANIHHQRSASTVAATRFGRWTSWKTTEEIANAVGCIVVHLEDSLVALRIGVRVTAKGSVGVGMKVGSCLQKQVVMGLPELSKNRLEGKRMGCLLPLSRYRLLAAAESSPEAHAVCASSLL